MPFPQMGPEPLIGVEENEICVAAVLEAEAAPAVPEAEDPAVLEAAAVPEAEVPTVLEAAPVFEPEATAAELETEG